MKNKVSILNFEEVAIGTKLCLDNAKNLIEEAEILYNNKKYRGSLVFALFAWEECAKISQIFNLLEPLKSQAIADAFRFVRESVPRLRRTLCLLIV